MSNRNKFPIITFGDFVDFSTDWSAGTNITVTSGETDPFGGTDAYDIEDTAAGGSSESVTNSVGALTVNADGEAIVSLYVKDGGNSDNVDINLRDQTAGVNRHIVQVNFTPGPVPILTTDGGSGTIFPVVSVGNSWYFIRFSVAGIVAVNSHTLFIYPAGTGVGTGDIIVYARPTILFGQHIDVSRAWSQPRAGSQWVLSPSGVEDAWITGDDEMLAGVVRWVPILDTANPQNRTGWDGRREDPMVNVGWANFLKFAQTAQIVVFSPDQALVATKHNVYVELPRAADVRRPEIENADMTRKFELVLRDSDDTPFEGY